MTSIPPSASAGGYLVGGVRLPRPFRIRRLGHFGVNVADPEVTRGFYERLMGFRISDKLDLTARFKPEDVPSMGPMVGYFTRHGTDHHSFVFFPRKALSANYKHASEFPEVTTNQITWQVGSLREVVEGLEYFRKLGLRIHRAGRDSPGSNWHTYPFDPDGHVNEVYYGIEQIGWDGLSKPMAMHEFRYTEAPGLPHRSEYAEVVAGHARGVDPNAGWRQVEPLAETYDVGGVLLARPFKVVRVGPVRLFIKDLDRALAFYRDVLGLSVTEEITWNGHRCVFLRANTEHHSLALYPTALRAELGLNPDTTLFSFGMQVADYAQLKGALGFLGEHGVAIRKLPPELFPGIDYSAFACDPDGHLVQLYYAMEQVGWDGRPRPAGLRPVIDNANWPDTVEALPETFIGEPFLGPWN
jgi:catechol 2,3-dioxygenase-like lactoylglutathione lyase family enzyme